MAKQNNRTCIICGKQYHYCPTCGSDGNKPYWYFIFDGENCHDIYEICVAYRDKTISVKEAYERISKVNISDLEHFAPSTKAQIEEILSYKNTSDTASISTSSEKEDTALKTTNTKNNKNKK